MSEQLPVFIGMKEAARILNVSRIWLYKMIKNGDGPPHYNYTSRRRFKKDELFDWIRQHKVKS